MNRRIDISYKTIFFISGFLALLWALFLIRDVIILFFIAIIFMSALAPVVKQLESKLKLPKSLAIALIYVIIITIVAGLLSVVVTPLIEQTSNLALSLPATLDKLLPSGTIDKSLLQQSLGDFSKNALAFTFLIFSNFLTFISIAVLTFYLLLERGKLDKLISQFALGHEERIKRITLKIEEKLGSWMRGQIVLSFIIGTMAYIVLFIFKIPYAMPLAILAGLMEVVPVIGPIISSIPSILIAYLISPYTALFVAISFFIIQQTESHVVVPQVMKKAVGLNPLVVILAVATGGRLLGIAGALLAVPITVVIQIITEDILREEKS